MKAYRIALRRFGATKAAAFGGRSGYAADGRWHSSGRWLDYAAQSVSLATLERLVHYKRFNCFEAHLLYEVDIPNAMIETVNRFPRGWDGDDLSPAAQAVGNRWCDDRRSPALLVPSAVTPGESNLLLNSRHPKWDWGWIAARPRKFLFTPRLVDLMTKRRQ